MNRFSEFQLSKGNKYNLSAQKKYTNREIKSVIDNILVIKSYGRMTDKWCQSWYNLTNWQWPPIEGSKNQKRNKSQRKTYHKRREHLKFRKHTKVKRRQQYKDEFRRNMETIQNSVHRIDEDIQTSCSNNSTEQRTKTKKF